MVYGQFGIKIVHSPTNVTIQKLVIVAGVNGCYPPMATNTNH